VVVLQLDFVEERIYLSKEAFEHKLSIIDIRVLVLITSRYNFCVENFSADMKRWCIKKPTYSNSVFAKVERKLIAIGLIDVNGCSKRLGRDYLIFPSLDIFIKCKTVKQLFVYALNFWNKKHPTLILSPKLFYDLFPTKRAFQRACDTLGYPFEYNEKNGKIFIFKKKAAENKSMKNYVEVDFYGRTDEPYLPYDIDLDD
jgi:hypothetical protein